jgi:predicted kinase
MRRAATGDVPDQDLGARLVLLCGLPGSGKSTAAARLASEMQAIRLSPDDWMSALGMDLWDEDARDRIERQLWRLAQDLLRRGQRVILEFGFWLRSDRDEKRLAARELAVRVELRYLDVSIDELVRRLEARTGQAAPATAPITRAHLEGWLSSFESPDDEEMALFDPPTGERHV